MKPDKVTGAPVKRTLRRVDAAGAQGRSRASRACAARWLDPFGHTEERRLERQLDRATTSARWRSSSAACGADNLALAAEIAALPATIRGYGHVKRKNIDAAKAREAALLAQFRAPARREMPLAA